MIARNTDEAIAIRAALNACGSSSLERELDDRIVRAPDDRHQEQEQVNHDRRASTLLALSGRERWRAAGSVDARRREDHAGGQARVDGRGRGLCQAIGDLGRELRADPAARRARPTFRPGRESAPAGTRPTPRAPRAGRTRALRSARRSLGAPPAGLRSSPSIVRENSHSNATPLSAIARHRHDRPTRLPDQTLSTIRRMPTNPFSFGTPMSDSVISSDTAATNGIAFNSPP